MKTYQSTVPGATLPGVLGKAAEDHCWSYLAELKSGRQYLFCGAEDLGGGWLLLKAWDPGFGGVGDLLDLIHGEAFEVPERGLTVRLDEIRWAAEVRG